MHPLDLRWIVPAAFIISVEYLVAFVIGARAGLSHSIPFGTWLSTGVLFATIGLLVGLLWQLYRLWREGEEHPSRYILGRLPWAFGVSVMLLACQAAVLQWTKAMMPLAVGFWADPLFADLDHSLFGQDPWRLSHALFGWLTPAIDRLYATWAPAKVSVLFIVFCHPASVRKARLLIAYFLIMACGALGQYLGPSAGPVFYELLDLGDRFKELPVMPWVATARDYLWADYTHPGGRLGTGISAMPSMHVAGALWMVLAARSYLPRFQAVVWLYFAVILVGSVHLGWHYAVDGLASCIFVVAIWKLAQVLATVPLERARQPAATGES